MYVQNTENSSNEINFILHTEYPFLHGIRAGLDPSFCLNQTQKSVSYPLPEPDPKSRNSRNPKPTTSGNSRNPDSNSRKPVIQKFRPPDSNSDHQKSKSNPDSRLTFDFSRQHGGSGSVARICSGAAGGGGDSCDA